MRILHVDASARSDWSTSRALSRRFVEVFCGCVADTAVTYLDLAKEPPSHPTELYTRAIFTLPTERAPASGAVANPAIEAAHADSETYKQTLHRQIGQTPSVTTVHTGGKLSADRTGPFALCTQYGQGRRGPLLRYVFQPEWN